MNICIVKLIEMTSYAIVLIRYGWDWIQRLDNKMKYVEGQQKKWYNPC